MSGDAGTWARAQDCPDRNAKQVLVHMAAYADPDGFVWAKVSLLALEMEASERTVQRGIRRAVELRLLEETPHRKLHLGRLVPVYRLPMERGPANTRDRLKALKSLAAGEAATGDNLSPVGCGQISTGDTCVAPRGDIGDGRGVTPVSPVSLKTPREQFQENTQNGRASFAGGEGSGVDVDELDFAGGVGEVGLGEEGLGEPGSAGGVSDEPGEAEIGASFDRVWPRWAAAVPDGAARPLDLAAWIAAVEAGVRLGELETGALGYLERSPAVKRGRGRSLMRWLAEEGWRNWQPDAAGPKGLARVSAFSAPAAVMALLRSDRQRDWIAYLLGCGWVDRPGAGVIEVRTSLVADALAKTFGDALAAMGVRIVVRRAA